MGRQDPARWQCLAKQLFRLEGGLWLLLNVMNEGGPAGGGSCGRSSASNNVGQARAVTVRAAGYSKRRTDPAHGTPWDGLILLVFL